MEQAIMILATFFFTGSLTFAIIAYIYVRSSKKSIVKHIINDTHLVYTFKPQSFDIDDLQTQYGIIGHYNKGFQDSIILDKRSIHSGPKRKTIETTLAFEKEYA